MIGTMGPLAGVDAVADGAAGRGAGGVVARPRLFGRLAAAPRVSVVSAPAGSGKTVLLRSWISGAGVAGRAAWVPAGRGERDPQRFWLSVLAALRQTGLGSALVREVTAAPDLDGWVITERLLKDLAPLDDQLWLVVDDVQELGGDALRQLELLIMRAPPGLRFVLATRRDVRLGLHRLRLEGELAEIREPDLRFTVAEAAELFAAAGVRLPEVAPLVARTEGWAAGLRLAALSLAGHPDPGRLAAEFSGTERTVAEYLLAEVLDRQPEPVRRLLLRTSILERVNGELAGLLTGDSGGERVLADLEAANAFVVALSRFTPARRVTFCKSTATGSTLGGMSAWPQRLLQCLSTTRLAPQSGCARRWRCGAGRRWPTSPMSRLRRPRSGGWRNCGLPRWRSGLTRSWRPRGSVRWWASWARSSPSTRCVSVSARK